MLLPLILAAVAGASLVTDSSSYSFYVFTLEWKPTMCLTTTCVSGYYSEAFNIHGLWPSTSPSNGPSNCNGASFSVSNSVQEQLETCWLSDSGTPQSFWEHEWSKHGTCIVPATTPDAFFTKVVALFSQFNPQKTLAAGGVAPSNSKTYSLATIYAAFPNKINIQSYSSSGKCYLETVQLCLDLNFSQIDCEEVSSGCSDGEFIFPSSD